MAEWRKRGTRRVYVDLLHQVVQEGKKSRETDENNEGRVGKLLSMPYSSVRKHRRTSEVTPISRSM